MNQRVSTTPHPMIRKKVLGIGTNSATLLVADTESDDRSLRVLRRNNTESWPARDIQVAHTFYQDMYMANLAGFVHIHAVLLQDGYLNVVTTFCAGGDLATYLDEEVHDPLPEKQALLWVLVMSLAVEHLQKAHLSFYGLNLNRIYLDGDHGAAGILLGLPMPPFLYFKQMLDRRKDGVAVQHEYPPEVLEKKYYHATLSDVWHLGRIALQLLSAHTEISRRSPMARMLLEGMTAPSMEARWSLVKVIDTLRGMVGDVKLPTPQPMEQVSSGNLLKGVAAGIYVATPTTCSSSGTRLSANHGNIDSGGRVVSTPLASARSNTSSPPTSTTTKTQRAQASTPNKTRHPQSFHVSKEGDIPATITAVRAPFSIQTSSRGEAAPPRPGTGRGSRGDPEGNALWHRRAMEQFQELQRLNASPRRNLSRNGTPGRVQTPRSYLEETELVQNRLDFAWGPADGARQRQASPFERRAKSPPVLNARGVPLDNNTRMLQKMLGAQQHQPSKEDRCLPRSPTERRHRQHLQNMPQGNQGDGGTRQKDIWKHIKAWARHQHQDPGIRLPQKRTSPARRSSPANKENAVNYVVKTNDVGGKGPNSRVPVTITVPNRPPPLSLETEQQQQQQRCSVTPVHLNTSRSSLTCASPRRLQPNHPQRLPHSLPPQDPALLLTSAPPLTVPLLRIPSPTVATTPILPMQQYTLPVVPQSRGPPSPMIRPATPSDPPAASTTTFRTSSVGLASGVGLKDGALLTTMQWHVDGVRGALRSLLRRQTLYSDAMQIVTNFLARPEEQRLDPHCNEAFMLELRGLFKDPPLFMAASPLCAQLVALEAVHLALTE